jgi:hypothetical protein
LLPVAIANVALGGSFIGDTVGFSSVTHDGTGLYTLTLTDTPGSLSNIIAVVTLRSGNAPMAATYSMGAPNLIHVDIFDATGTLADRDFSVVVYNS